MRCQLESVYRAANIVSNICVYASPARAKPIAIVIPSPKILIALASSNNITPNPLDQLIRDPQTKELVLKELQNMGKKAGLAPFEIIEGVVLADEEWSSQNVSARCERRGGIGLIV